MLTLNLIRKLYIPFVLKAFQEPKSMQKIKQCWKNNPKKKKKNYLKYNIGMKAELKL